MITNILEYLEKSAESFAAKTAYADGENELSFGELMAASKSLGSFILRKKIKRGPILVYLKKSPKCLAGFFGCTYAGHPYVPLDTQMPSARIALIRDSLKPSAVITDEECREAAESLFSKELLIDYSEAAEAGAEETLLKRVREEQLDTDPLYILYTSGSTGVPKGVVITHRGLIDYMENFCSELEISSDEIIANQAPFYFDASLIDIYCTLKMGASMHIVPIELFSMPLKLLEFLQEKKITMIRWVPSALNMVSAFKALKSLRPEYLRIIIFGAESMPTKCFNYWRSFYPEEKFVQIYGPTEITGVCTYYIVDREFEDSETIPIGRAFKNSGVFLLSEENTLIDKGMPGVQGEICVKGSCLAAGYYNDMEKTKAVFVQNPLVKEYEERIYRTGDLASYNELGELVFASRKDFQIKHMGHRIELGEIENAAISLEGMKAAVCLFDQKKSKIHLVYVSEELEDNSVINYLKEMLPRYMIPNMLHHIEKMPLTASGKADRNGLKKTYIGG